jgi:hypothetical protein
VFLHSLDIPATDAGRPDNVSIMKSEIVAKTEVDTTSPAQIHNAGEDQVSIKGSSHQCHSVPYGI